MGISENFLVNTESFDPIIKALISRSEQPEKITEHVLEEMGYDNPSDLLVIHVLRGLDIINQDKTPTELYKKMVDPKRTNEAIAEGIINGYHELFERNFDVHKMLPGELKEELSDYFAGKKTDLIIKYIANTFHKLVCFAGFHEVEEARDQYFRNKTGTSAGKSDYSERNGNGFSLPHSDPDNFEDQKESRTLEEILFGGEQSEAEDTSKDDDTSESKTMESEAIRSDDSKPEEPAIRPEAESDFSSDPEADAQPEERKAPPDLDISNKKVCKAIIKRADLQYKLKYYGEALESSQQIISYFDDSDDEFLKKAVANAIIRRAEALKKLGEGHKKLLPALNKIISKFSDSDNEEYYDHASKAMLEKASILEQNEFEKKDLLPLYDTIIKRLKHESEPSVRERVDRIFVKKLGLISEYGERSDLLSALDESIDRFKKAEKFRKYLEEAMFRKAELLEDMNRDEEALAAYTAFLKEFGKTIET